MRSFRRILERGRSTDEPGAPLANQAQLDAEERARDLELLREEQARMTELTRRQLRYADHVWRPPDQGGERRSGDQDDPSDVA